MSMSPDILVVRHGEGRGRLLRYGHGRGRTLPYFQPFWDHLRDNKPEVFARIRFFETGNPMPSLEGIRCVLFLLGDPLETLYPNCYEEAVRIRDGALARGISVYQDPDALSGYGRVAQARRWQEAGIPTADVHAFASRSEMLQILSDPGPPLLLRKDHGHSQTDIRLVMDHRDLDEIMHSQEESSGVAIQFIDTRQGYRDTQPASVYARYFHKKRAFVVGNSVRTNHVYFSQDPIVGLHSSTFWMRRPRRGDLRHPRPYIERYSHLWACLREDYAYWEKQTEHESLLCGAAAALGLSFTAIDYSTLSDGGVVLWEANPYPGCVTHSPLPRLRHSERRAKGIFDALASGLTGLADQSAAQTGRAHASTASLAATSTP